MKLLAICLTTLVALSAQAQSTATPHGSDILETISVSGNGHAQVQPDRVTFNVGVETVAPTVDEAITQNNARVANVVAALKHAGAADREIATSNFSINPQQEYTQGKLPRILGYQVSNSVTVTREKITDVGRLLQAAITAGVNQASGLSFTVADPARGREESLRMAFDDARRKAQTLAAAAGRTLGRAMSISEGNVVMPPRPMMGKMAMAAEVQSDVPVESGTTEVTSAVSVIFELR
jgi:uncharacterized protein YggE